MASTPSSSADRGGRPPELFAADADPRFVFRTLLARLPFPTLRSIAAERGHESEAMRSSTLAAELTEMLDDPISSAAIRKQLSDGDRLTLGLFGLTESRSWPLAGLRHATAALGLDGEVVDSLLRRGLLVLEAPLEAPGVDPSSLSTESASLAEIWPHPALVHVAKLRPPADPPLTTAASVVQVRESDGLEAILRLGALWQRTGAGPLRRTQQGVLYKRDRERIEEDGVLSAPIDDALVELPALPTLWMGLARRVGLIHVDQSDESLNAAPAEFWTENAVHLPQMVASAWLGLRSWNETMEAAEDGSETDAPVVFLRPAVLLWLATLEPDAWTTLDELAARLDMLTPGWERVGFNDESNPTGQRRGRASAKKGAGPSREAQAARVLERILVGGAYTLGLVRSGEEDGSRKRVVQLTALGRYVLAMGPPPPARPTFEHFLFVQPNLEVIAYRQGLTPPLIGRLSQFAWWFKIGAAVELRLTQESITMGLEWGLSPHQIQETLARHSQRVLPSAVKDAVDRWADRREQVTFYSSATLIEFNGAAERDQAIASWTAEGLARRPFVPVGDRFILVENPQEVPTSRISTTASRDYRLPPERCVTVEADGVTLTLDPARSDLLVEAELSRFADEERNPPSPGRGVSRRRFSVTATTLGRAAEAGLTPVLLADWFLRRTGEAPTPAVRLMMRPTEAKGRRPWPARRLLVLTAPSAELLDGIMQHPETGPLLSERLGPVSVVVSDDQLDRLRIALQRFGVEFELS
ncbi:helicase-associated domain-containing protein [Paludisphaera rhizosphaerae]|uniref:helicase-associated domain-containing protein n=1 Tax=Paludisphaera rhizosphaerae TaxID=2711216 RepID=UPI0013EA93E5|nr:helicase-associated domain-containing protein [Paludisphaera rhizosphaerae]